MLNFKFKNLNFKLISEFIFLSLSIFLLFSFSYHLYTFHDWTIPLGYGGDLLLGLSIIQAYMLEQIPLFGYKFVDYLNAPGIANWNDYPVTEDVVFFLTGQLAKIIGLYAATNFLLFLSHFLAGISFWGVCRYYKINFLLAFSGAIFFAFSHFIFIRGLGHIVVGLCWHIPLILMIIEMVYAKRINLSINKKFFFAVLISILTGFLNPYYSIMYCQLLIFSAIFFYFKKDFKAIKVSLMLLLITFLSFLLVNFETIFYSIEHGSNSAFSGRNIPSLELYALKIPDMIFAPGGGSFFTDFSRMIYYDEAYLKGEYWSPYIGFFGIFSAIIFYFINTKYFFKGDFKRITVNYWHSIWITLFSIVGGLNLVIGIAGFTFLRATNRYSIFLLTIFILYTLKYIDKKKLSFKYIFLISSLIFYSVWYEQLGHRIKANPPKPNHIETMLSADISFVKKIENVSFHGKVFIMPVMKFPEVGPINGMSDYQPFRLSLNSNTLHYSYGSNKGRGDTDWQYSVEESSPEQIVFKLQNYGFDVLVIHKKGFADNAEWIIKKLNEFTSIITENDDFIAFKLIPNLVNYEPIITYGEAWSEDEETHRWAIKSKAEIAFTNLNNFEKNYEISFNLMSLRDADIEIYLNGINIKNIEIPVGQTYNFEPFIFRLLPGKNLLTFKSNRWPRRPNNGDMRKLTFAIGNLKLSPND